MFFLSFLGLGKKIKLKSSVGHVHMLWNNQSSLVSSPLEKNYFMKILHESIETWNVGDASVSFEIKVLSSFRNYRIEF